MRVNICLSTYNGGDFLAEQIESIRGQTFKEWKLLIRDDGSMDETIEIIKRFEKLDQRIRFLNPDDQENKGFVKSFFELIKADSADYYFFSDQDDVWLSNKLDLMLKEAERHDNRHPNLFYTNYRIVDKDLTVIHERMLRQISTTLVEELTVNSVNGWTSMINHQLAELWISTDKIDFHDWYLAELAAAAGELVYIDEVTWLYRQHQQNFVGLNEDSKNKSLRSRLTETWLLIGRCQARAEQVLFSGANFISAKNQKILKDFIFWEEKNIFKRMFLLLKYRYKRLNLVSSWKLHFLLFTNLGYRNGSTKR